MVAPYRQPELGSKPRLYRLLRDDTYHTAGTILCLDEDQVTGAKHERIYVHLEPEVEALIADMKARLDRLDPPAEPAAAEPLALPAPEDAEPVADDQAPTPPAATA